MILLSTEDSSIVCASKTQFNDKYIIEIMLLSIEDSRWDYLPKYYLNQIIQKIFLFIIQACSTFCKMMVTLCRWDLFMGYKTYLIGTKICYWATLVSNMSCLVVVCSFVFSRAGCTSFFIPVWFISIPKAKQKLQICTCIVYFILVHMVNKKDLNLSYLKTFIKPTVHSIRNKWLSGHPDTKNSWRIT